MPTQMKVQPNELAAHIDADLYENSPDCIKILTIDGTITRVSPGGRVALELDNSNELNGGRWPSLWPGSERSVVERAISNGRLGKRTQFTSFCPTVKGNPRWWDVVVTPMMDESELVSGLLVVSRDVTELVLAKEELSQANARKDEFLTILSHELRNPLSALAMAAKILERSEGGVTHLASIGGLITRQVGHIARLAENLLDISRITRGEVSLHVEEFDFGDVVHDATEQLGAVLASKNQTLATSLPEARIPFHGDRVRLTQVLGNLVGNASRYSPENSSIRVSLRADHSYLTISVSDEGQGITPEFMPKLFDMYSQGQSQTDRGATGVGLGLAIVKGLVELHGGTVRAESEGVGMGSTFVILLKLQTT